MNLFLDHLNKIRLDGILVEILVMISIIDKGTTVAKLKAAIDKVQSKKGVNTIKYCGIIKLKESPLSIQKKMRYEWS